MLSDLVARLPELYQPIYGHVELSGTPSRSCHDRLQEIIKHYDNLQVALDRPLRVLDLGCAQGYFSLSLAARGASVLGIDISARNIAVCQALATENNNLDAVFKTATIEDVVADMQMGQFDLVLGLSVFHHLIHANGIAPIRQLLSELADLTGALIIESALRDEPPYWAKAQPKEPQTLLADIAFVREIGQFATHLSGITRPLYVASHHYCLLDDRAEAFSAWSNESHALADGAFKNSRRYFYGDKAVVKKYQFDHALGKVNRTDFSREVAFFQSPPQGFEYARLIATHQNENEAWVVMERLPGKLLMDCLQDNEPLDRHGVISDILDQLCILEANGLYHNDLRTWNILVDTAGKARLIDFGSITDQPKDCAWPDNIYFSFLAFVHQVATGRPDTPAPLRVVAFRPVRLPPPYQAWASSFWQQPLAAWSFAAMRASFPKAADAPDDALQAPMDAAWTDAMEKALRIQAEYARYMVRYSVALAQKPVKRVKKMGLEIVLQRRFWRMHRMFGQLRRLKAEGLQSRSKSLAQKVLRAFGRRAPRTMLHKQPQPLATASVMDMADGEHSNAIAH